MSVFLSSAIIVSSLSMMIFIRFRNIRYKEMNDSKNQMVPWVFLMETILVAADLWAGPGTVMRLPLDLAVTMLPMMAISSSVWKQDIAVRIAYAGLVCQGLLAILHGLAAMEILRPMPLELLRILLFLVSLTYPVMYFLSLWWRIRDVKAVMKSGTVWTSLCLAVESFYVISVTLNIYGFLILISFVNSPWISAIVVLLLAGEIFALGLRVTFDCVFVFLHRHERRIIESLKVSHVEVSNEGSKDDPHYLDVYERVVAYFENEKPYLNSELTINDIVKVVFTNKLYISKAISQYTGRNFCQFVNYYRVTHSVNAFRNNPEMKVVELANACGFNSVVSFNMAFRLYMNENPSDWCRKERSRLIKGKNKLWNR